MQNNLVRTIHPSDIQFIYEIDQATNSNPWSLENFNSSIRNYLGYVYLHEQKLTSFLIFANQMDYTEILLLATAPAFQKQHFASQLLHCLVEYTQNKQIGKILLEVRKSNTKAQQFYQKNGFGYLNTRKNYYQYPTEDALVMEKKC